MTPTMQTMLPTLPRPYPPSAPPKRMRYVPAPALPAFDAAGRYAPSAAAACYAEPTALPAPFAPSAGYPLTSPACGLPAAGLSPTPCMPMGGRYPAPNVRYEPPYDAHAVAALSRLDAQLSLGPSAASDAHRLDALELVPFATSLVSSPPLAAPSPVPVSSGIEAELARAYPRAAAEACIDRALAPVVSPASDAASACSEISASRPAAHRQTRASAHTLAQTMTDASACVLAGLAAAGRGLRRREAGQSVTETSPPIARGRIAKRARGRRVAMYL